MRVFVLYWGKQVTDYVYGNAHIYDKKFANTYNIAILSCLLAIFVRVLFWVFTDRVWEDSLIALASARNLWAGNGWTHHSGEVAVQSFTSPLGQFVMVLGEAFGQGLSAVRLASLACSAGAVFYASRIMKFFGVEPVPMIMALGYLAVDHAQVFFGMAGMETQIATFLLLLSVYLFFSEKWGLLGFCLGLGLLCRVEFIFLIFPIGIYMLVFHQRDVLGTIIKGVSVVVPWVIFSIIYYGTPIPITIRAKEALTQASFFGAGFDGVWSYFLDAWKPLAPFLEYRMVATTPVPSWLLLVVVGALLGSAIYGLYFGAKQTPKALVPTAALLLFAIYRVGFTIDPYFMWYLPPFVALTVVFSGVGVSHLELPPRGRSAIAIFVLLPYAIQIPFMLPIDRTVQTDIDTAVRAKVGKRLNDLMQKGDTAFLEPLGYVGWYAPNKTILDFPGLSSPRSLSALEKHPGQGMPGVIPELMPTYMALRPRELADVRKWIPKVAAQYRIVERIQAKKGLKLEHWGVSYFPTDTEFVILRIREAS